MIIFKVRHLGNIMVLIITFKNMVVKFVGGCSVATRGYVIIYSVSKIYSFDSACGITIAIVLVYICQILFSICYSICYSKEEYL